MRNDFDPFKALQYQGELDRAIKDMIGEAIMLIEDDRPNAARRHLQSALEFGPEKRLRARSAP